MLLDRGRPVHGRYGIHRCTERRSEASYAPRKLKDAGNNKLEYNLYTANTYTTVWVTPAVQPPRRSGTGAGMGVPQAAEP